MKISLDSKDKPGSRKLSYIYISPFFQKPLKNEIGLEEQLFLLVVYELSILTDDGNYGLLPCFRHITYITSLKHHHKSMLKVLLLSQDSKVTESKQFAHGHIATKWLNHNFSSG